MPAGLSAKLKDLQSLFCWSPWIRALQHFLYGFFSSFSYSAILTSPGTSCSALRSIALGKDCGWSLGKHLSCFSRGIISFQTQFQSKQAPSAVLRQPPAGAWVGTNPRPVAKTGLFISKPSFPSKAWNSIYFLFFVSWSPWCFRKELKLLFGWSRCSPSICWGREERINERAVSTW